MKYVALFVGSVHGTNCPTSYIYVYPILVVFLWRILTNTIILCHPYGLSINPLQRINSGRGWRNCKSTKCFVRYVSISSGVYVLRWKTGPKCGESSIPSLSCGIERGPSTMRTKKNLVTFWHFEYVRIRRIRATTLMEVSETVLRHHTPVPSRHGRPIRGLDWKKWQTDLSDLMRQPCGFQAILWHKLGSMSQQTKNGIIWHGQEYLYPLHRPVLWVSVLLIVFSLV